MKTFWSFISACVLSACLSVSAFAQVASRDSFQKIMEATHSFESIDQTTLMSAFEQSVKSWTPGISDADAAAIRQKYMDSKFKEDLTDIYYSYCRQLTEQDAQQVLTLLGTPDGKAAFDRCMQYIAGIRPVISEETSKAVAAIVSGTDMPAAPTCKAMPESYVKKFDQYWSITHLDQMMDNIMSSMKAMGANIPDEKKESFNTAMDKLSNYFQTALRPLTFNSLCDKMPEADLDFYIKLYGSEAGQHLNADLLPATSDITALGNRIIGRFADWYQANK